MKRKAALWIPVGLLSLAALWVVSTWFFFGAIHPCGILEYRQRAFVEIGTLQALREGYDAASALWKGRPLTNELLETMMAATDKLGPANIEKEVADALKMNRDRIWRHSPFECLRGAITWRRPGKTALELLEE